MAKRSGGGGAKASKPQGAPKVQARVADIPELDIDSLYQQEVHEIKEPQQRRKRKTSKKWWDKKTKGMTVDKKELAKRIHDIYEANEYSRMSEETPDKFTVEQLQNHLENLQSGKYPWITKKGILNA